MSSQRSRRSREIFLSLCTYNEALVASGDGKTVGIERQLVNEDAEGKRKGIGRTLTVVTADIVHYSVAEQRVRHHVDGGVEAGCASVPAAVGDLVAAGVTAVAELTDGLPGFVLPGMGGAAEQHAVGIVDVAVHAVGLQGGHTTTVLVAGVDVHRGESVAREVGAIGEIALAQQRQLAVAAGYGGEGDDLCLQAKAGKTHQDGKD